MSNAKPMDREKRLQNYRKQSAILTARQHRQLLKTDRRRDGAKNHEILREKQRNRRQRFREWMEGMR